MVYESSVIPRVKPKVRFPDHLVQAQNSIVDEERGCSREYEAEQRKALRESRRAKKRETNERSRMHDREDGGPAKRSERLPTDEDNSDRKADNKDSAKVEEAFSKSPPSRDVDMEDWEEIENLGSDVEGLKIEVVKTQKEDPKTKG